MAIPPQPHPGGISRYAGRSTRRYKQQRATFRTECATHTNADGTIGAHCWLCGKPIDYDLPPEHPESFSLDHAHPVATHPELAEDPANFRPAHLIENQQRGDGEPFIHHGSPSENW